MNLQEKLMEKNVTKTTWPGQSGLPTHEVLVRAMPNAMEPTLDGVSINYEL